MKENNKNVDKYNWFHFLYGASPYLFFPFVPGVNPKNKRNIGKNNEGKAHKPLLLKS